ncbi:hypothetical protein LL946_06325 [Knoellia locipacati]|uniref:DUF6602 domain-containing protein n=1 Tax=Knoellia locipacati TaxID=882824 RepID=UPI00384EC6C9
MSDFDLRKAFLARQRALIADLGITGDFTDHGTTIGDASEADWLSMLRDFLPARYGVGAVTVVDSAGRKSHQIDLAIWDQQYSPNWFTTSDGDRFIPAESVYAVFEVKPEIDKEYVEYAGLKIASVRDLVRVPAPIHHLGGRSTPPDLDSKPILGGIVALRSGWKTTLAGPAGKKAIHSQTGNRRIDLGIALDDLSFDHNLAGQIEYSPAGTQLIFFAIRLFQRLQPLATAFSPDMTAYEKALDESQR